MRVAAFVTPHGFGHAGRAAAVLDALHARRPGAEATLFTTVPEAFFIPSLHIPWRRVPVEGDVGLVQESALAFDLEATARAVAAFLDDLPRRADAAAERLLAEGCDVVLCDVAPLGIEAARRAGVPSVLVENFTWDWIYEPLAAEVPALEPLRLRLGALFDAADVRVQCEPVCRPVAGSLRVAPVARAPRMEEAEARAALGLDEGHRAVLVTLGGVPQALPFLDRLRARDDVAWLVTGLPREGWEGNVRFLHREAPAYLPDVLIGVDAVVAKLGYSTVAETWRAGRPLAWVPRPAFREGRVLARWVEANLPGFPVQEDAFLAGGWIDEVDALLTLPRHPVRSGGADDAAAALEAGAGAPV